MFTIDEIELSSIQTFWNLLSFVKEKDLCIKPGCTTCGAGDYRYLLKLLSYGRLSKMLNEVTLEEIIRQNDLIWHDALEILLVDFSSESFKDSVIMREYKKVFELYYQFRKIYRYSMYDARVATIKAIKEQSEWLYQKIRKGNSDMGEIKELKSIEDIKNRNEDEPTFLGRNIKDAIELPFPPRFDLINRIPQIIEEMEKEENNKLDKDIPF